MKGNLQIVIAWTEDVQELDEARSRNVRRDLGEANKFKDVKKPFAAMWLNKGTEADVAKARAYAGGEGKKVFVYTGAGDPLGRAKADVLRGKATDIALIPEADGAEFIKPTDGALKGKTNDAVTMEEIAEAGRAMVAAQRSGDKAKIRAAQNAYRALRDQAEREEAEHYIAVQKLNRRPGAEKEHQSMLRAMKHGPGAKAQDGILSSPFMALAALLAILNHFNKETVGPQDYDLTTYRHKKKEW